MYFLCIKETEQVDSGVIPVISLEDCEAMPLGLIVDIPEIAETHAGTSGSTPSSQPLEVTTPAPPRRPQFRNRRK